VRSRLFITGARILFRPLRPRVRCSPLLLHRGAGEHDAMGVLSAPVALILGTALAFLLLVGTQPLALGSAGNTRQYSRRIW